MAPEQLCAAQVHHLIRGNTAVALHPQPMHRPLSPTLPRLAFLAGAAVLATAPAIAQQTTRASVSSAGVQGDRASNRISVVTDGSAVSFESNSTNFVAGDLNFVQDVFFHDMVTGLTERVSVNSLGVEGNGESKRSVISGNGRYVAFISIADNLDAPDGNLTYDIFVRDRLSSTTTTVSVTPAGVAGNAISTRPAISQDGRFIAFRSSASDLIPDDNNGVDDIFVYDQQTGLLERVSVSSTGVESNLSSDRPSISGDGNLVAFYSDATNLVPGDTNFVRDIFIHDRSTGVTTLISKSAAGQLGNGPSSRPSVSADGNFVAFHSDASNLVSGDTNFVADVFVYDVQKDTIELISKSSTGVLGNGLSSVPSISEDGSRVAYRSVASNLVPGDTNFLRDVFLHDRGTGETTRVSVSTAGAQGNGDSSRPSISHDGTHVGFQSFADNLVPGDTNLEEDVFVHEVGAPPPNIDTIVLTGPSSHPVGASATYSWSDAPASSPYWFVYSFTLTGQVVQGHPFDVGVPAVILATGVTSSTGAGSYTSPPVPAAAQGRTIYFEVAVQSAGVFYDSNPLATSFT